MVRVVLLLLALPSLLMPPGLCVCRFARVDRVTPTQMPAEYTSRVSDDDAPRSGRCCKKCSATHSAAAPHSDSTDSRGEPTPVSPADRDHAPNCPAVGPSAAAKMVEPPILLPALLVVVGGCLVDDAAETTVSHLTLAEAPSPPAPRYISFRALLI